jgi:hypothetical protein
MLYGEVPAPVQVTVKVTDWPLSMAAAAAMATVAPVSWELTVAWSVGENDVCGLVEESVTE